MAWRITDRPDSAVVCMLRVLHHVIVNGIPPASTLLQPSAPFAQVIHRYASNRLARTLRRDSTAHALNASPCTRTPAAEACD
eukprot:39664-Eustigmatos_ZCMA.PRE.1